MGVSAAVVAALAIAGTSAGYSISSGEKAARESSRANDRALQQAASLPKADDPKNLTSASSAADRRRALFSNVGRSSTILTGPSGLGSAPTEGSTSTPKSLLGL